MGGRAKTGEAAAQALAAVYADLPAMRCEGLCSDSCFSMGQTRVEQTVIESATGVRLPLTHAGGPCAALTILKQCSIYGSRPMICRVWGMTNSMRCQFGCTPAGGFLTDAQAYEFLARVAEVDGDPVRAEQFRAPFRDDPAGAGAHLLRLQRERDLHHAEREARPDAVFLVGGQLVKRRPGRR